MLMILAGLWYMDSACLRVLYFNSTTNGLDSGVKTYDDDYCAEEDNEDDCPNPADTNLMLKIIRKGLVESQLDLEVQRQDPDSPLHSVKSFERLHLKPEILKGIYAMGFNAPSKIQETALPILLADPPQNLIAQSQSGTGKTAAFVITMLSEHIIIGTPAKLVDWCLKFRIFDLTRIKVFVLDEADIMIRTQGHHDQCIRIHKQLSRKCQMLLFSATYEQELMDFAQYIVPSPNITRLRREEETLDNIKQYYVRCSSPEDKYKAIENIYGCIVIGQAIIFCHSRKMAVWLAGKMMLDGHAVALLTGELTVEQCLIALDRFPVGIEKVLITTNVLSRGIDVEQVTIIVNFDLPINAKGTADCDTYLHRIGRTGRF
uniref:RNA helicase n=1 Tax=Glossina palpalis gambiensis TaxID=67801 RepID=A0A1B0ARH7_9MUSC